MAHSPMLEDPAQFSQKKNISKKKKKGELASPCLPTVDGWHDRFSLRCDSYGDAMAPDRSVRKEIDACLAKRHHKWTCLRQFQPFSHSHSSHLTACSQFRRRDRMHGARLRTLIGPDAPRRAAGTVTYDAGGTGHCVRSDRPGRQSSGYTLRRAIGSYCSSPTSSGSIAAR